MNKLKLMGPVLVLFVLASTCLGGDPNYQPVPGPNDPGMIATGIADAVGPGGTAFVEYWVWYDGSEYYYYSYRIHNLEEPNFAAGVKHLWIGNPSREEYIVTGSSGGGPVGGFAWTPSTWNPLGEVDLVKWTATDSSTIVHPNQSSWAEPLFQFASKLAPSIANFKVMEGTPQTYADGLILAPEVPAGARPRSPGYWKHQFIGLGGKNLLSDNDLEDALVWILILAPELDDVNETVFADRLSMTDDDYNREVVAPAILALGANSSIMSLETERQLLALWLNVTSGKLSGPVPLTFQDPNGNLVTKSPYEVINEIEAILQDTNSTTEQLEYAKNLAEILNHI